ncbi:MAG: FkbM family methyltransferase [Bryobacterales bacterium]|nr:FkbM family methyltransferase [Bryobacterales bacterium]
MRKWALSLKGLVGKESAARRDRLCIKRLEDEISGLKNELSRLNGIVTSGKIVDLVDFGELRVFMYTNDLSYVQLSDQYRHHTPSANFRDFTKPYRSPSGRYHNDREPLLSFLLSHYWLHDLDFAVFDVGCQYGSSAMAAAQVILSSGNWNHVYAFDPGEAGALARYNILLNGLESHVTFEHLAISKGTFPGMVFTETGHSENNRLVNRTPSLETSSFVVMCTSIDEYATRKNLSGHCVIKIDTQGGEVEVFEGMKHLRQTRHVTCISEFVPEAIATRGCPIEWLTRVSEGCSIFEVPGMDIFLSPSHSLRYVPPDTVARFVSEIRARPNRYTDIVLIPETLPGHAVLARKLGKPS